MDKIINLIYEKYNFNISCYNRNFLNNCLKERLNVTKSNSYDDYLKYLENNGGEFIFLLNSFNINVSKFFRDNLTFEFIEKIILPQLIEEKKKGNENNLRIWSAGCAGGEETYSLAILFREFLKYFKFNISILGSDIDRNNISKGKKGVYPSRSINEVKYGIINKYFIKNNESFQVIPEIKSMVNFYVYDLLDDRTYFPSQAVYGSFDLVLCRNVLIYFNSTAQERILKKLFRSLNKKSFLVLGEAEEPLRSFRNQFKKINHLFSVYQKY